MNVLFVGTVQCLRDLQTPLALTLVGHTAEHPGETLYLAFITAPPQDLPQFLENASVQQVDATTFSLSTPSQRWTLVATSVHVHRDVTENFYRAVPPRAAPLIKRVFWRVVLALAATPVGRSLLARRAR